MTWPCLQHLKLTKGLSQDKDQDIELFIEDIESGAKPVSTVKIKDEEGCIELAMLAATEAYKEVVTRERSSHRTLY